jgi:hypothetical protein
MTPAKRWTLWVVLLAAVAALSIFDRRPPAPGKVVDVVPRPAGANPAAHKGSGAATGSGEEQTLLAIEPRTVPRKIDDAFPPRDWRPPPPPVKPAPRAAPSVPPFPFQVFGKKLEDGVWQVFLARGNQIVVVKSSDTIDNVYRVEEIRPPVMTITYLPLQQRQSLQIGGAE